MSHVTDVRCRVRDVEMLDRVIAERFPELEFRRDQKTHAWWGKFVGDSTPPAGRDPKDFGRCDHAIGRKGCAPKNGSSGEYEIGVVRAVDGDGYDLLLDEYGPGRAVSQYVPALRREYAAAVATQSAVSKLSRYGWRVSREDLPGARIRLRLRKG